MSDSEYSSEDDEDYVPEFDSASEEGDIEGEDKTTESKKKSTQKKQAPKRKRKGGIKLEDDEDDNDNDDEQSDQDNEIEEQERIAKEQKKKEEDEKTKKARMDDLWAAFKSDTANVRLKPSTPLPSTCSKAISSKAESTSLPKTKELKEAKPAVSPPKPSTSKVTITKTFDFAGEAVTVTKTVDASSNEARKAQKQQEQDSKKPSTSAPPLSNFSGVKRTSGLGNILGQIGKKPKMSTLEKSKLDWETFKTETGISEDLKNFNKNGYLEKQDFLQRTDERLFEREKETRAAMRKQWSS